MSRVNQQKDVQQFQPEYYQSTQLDSRPWSLDRYSDSTFKPYHSQMLHVTGIIYLHLPQKPT